MAPLAPHEKILVDEELLAEDEHGDMDCVDCHGGDPLDPDWKTAHEDVTRDPSYPDAMKVCGDCHEEIAATAASSLHVTLQPYALMTEERSQGNEAVRAHLAEARASHCDSCHSSCGQCHVSRPQTVGGGLLDGHSFLKKPPMEEVCTACHGSRVKKEYFGENEGVLPDIHKQAYMGCEKCHTGVELHGDGTAYADRYQVADAPACLDCHGEIYTPSAEQAENHETHKGRVACQVCHAQPYKNCASCHLGKDANGLAFFKTQASWLDLKIGRNPRPSQKHPETFVLLRQVPVDRHTFDFYVEDALARFDRLPTWKYASPHNIRRKTEQNSACNNCHGNPSLFLQEKDIQPEERNANRTVVVPAETIPPPQ